VVLSGRLSHASLCCASPTLPPLTRCACFADSRTWTAESSAAGKRRNGWRSDIRAKKAQNSCSHLSMFRSTCFLLRSSFIFRSGWLRREVGVGSALCPLQARQDPSPLLCRRSVGRSVHWNTRGVNDPESATSSCPRRPLSPCLLPQRRCCSLGRHGHGQQGQARANGHARRRWWVVHELSEFDVRSVPSLRLSVL